ncbi:hypothetical protein QNH39_26425 [Neobacillus novalis]|uniref:Uncharacterized protein n=1 Tax=Neobacillus novalis TaxID=220687 RepID=A0AA95SAR0_9BACI|nr:hypothetical protein [Neobacillus novalis]WHY86067.1 hypothetical protein QNH39_26425 [Neobacillus novalis]
MKNIATNYILFCVPQGRFSWLSKEPIEEEIVKLGRAPPSF